MTGSTSQLVSGGTSVQAWCSLPHKAVPQLSLRHLMYRKAFCIPAKGRLSKPTSAKATDGSHKVGPPQAGTTLPACLPGKLWFLSSEMWFGWRTANFWGLPLAPFSQCSCYCVTQLLHYIMWVRDHLDGQTRVAPSGLDWAGGKPPWDPAWHGNWMRVCGGVSSPTLTLTWVETSISNVCAHLCRGWADPVG